MRLMLQLFRMTGKLFETLWACVCVCVWRVKARKLFKLSFKETDYTNKVE
jgi:hypothetical protein